VAQGQFAAGPTVPDGTTVRRGDLVFFGTGPSGVDHVGIYVGSGLMIEAPSPRQNRRFELPFSFEIAAA
jgi:cell wall-associated NlpC family hydrolase